MGLDTIHIVGHIAGNLGRRELAKELAQSLLLLWGIRRVAGRGQVSRSFSECNCSGDLLFNRARLALEPVGHEHLVLVVVIAIGQDVGSLDGLVKVAKDVEDDDDGLGSVGGASDI